MFRFVCDVRWGVYVVKGCCFFTVLLYDLTFSLGSRTTKFDNNGKARARPCLVGATRSLRSVTSTVAGSGRFTSACFRLTGSVRLRNARFSVKDGSVPFGKDFSKGGGAVDGLVIFPDKRGNSKLFKNASLDTIVGGLALTSTHVMSMKDRRTCCITKVYKCGGKGVDGYVIGDSAVRKDGCIKNVTNGGVNKGVRGYGFSKGTSNN